MRIDESSVMNHQLEMFVAPRSDTKVEAVDDFDAKGAADRLDAILRSLSGRKNMAYAVVARDPWADYDKGGRDLDSFDRKINRRKVMPSHEEREKEFRAEFVWLAYGFNVGRAKVKVCTLAHHAPREHLTREIATDSATGFSMVLGVPAEVVVGWVITGKLALDGES